MVSIGYLTPSEIGLFSTPEQVMKEARKYIETFKGCNGGFIPAPGCEFPPNGSLINAMAVVKAAKTYGVYS
ncbi:MAG: uroporphyrinogen decarboxylase family protein [Eubacteriales bacterium]